MSGANVLTADGPYLAPIEKPSGLVMRLLYSVARKMFGKVVTPLKVVNSRLPLGFSLFSFKIGKLDKQLTLPAETALLVRERVARINVCLFCIDIGRSFAIKASMNEQKFDALDQYQTSPLFTEADRAALDYVTELTRDKKCGPKRSPGWRSISPSGKSARSSGWSRRSTITT